MKLVNFILIIFVLLTSCKSPAGTEDYFPDKVFHKEPKFHKFINEWYLKHLTVLDEPSVYQRSFEKDKNIIRFTWLRTFNNPIAIRVEIHPDGSATLFTKQTNGAGGYEPGELVVNNKKEIPKKSVDKLVATIEKNKFWDLPNTIDSRGLDGSSWVIEYTSNGKYHLIDRWSPETGAARKIGLALLSLSGLKIKEKEIY